MNPTVLKISGKAMDTPSQAQSLWHAVAAKITKAPVVIVHGGGKQVDELLTKLGEPIDRIDGIRITPKSQIDIVAGVLAGQVNLHIIGALRAVGIHAVGLSLGSHGVLECDKDNSLNVSNSRVGKPIVGDAQLVRTLLSSGYIPVISSIGIDNAGGLLNINADDAAAALAVSLEAQTLIYVSDVQGVADAHGKHLDEVATEHIENMIASGTVTGGMAAKLRSAAIARSQGVRQVQITSISGATEYLKSEPTTSTAIMHNKVGAS